jgi:hypothetical protein
MIWMAGLFTSPSRASAVSRWRGRTLRVGSFGRWFLQLGLSLKPMRSSIGTCREHTVRFGTHKSECVLIKKNAIEASKYVSGRIRQHLTGDGSTETAPASTSSARRPCLICRSASDTDLSFFCQLAAKQPNFRLASGRCARIVTRLKNMFAVDATHFQRLERFWMNPKLPLSLVNRIPEMTRSRPRTK